MQTKGFRTGSFSCLTMYSTPHIPIFIALEASIGEPPPIAMIRSTFLSLYAAIQASTVSIDGFGSISSKTKYWILFYVNIFITSSRAPDILALPFPVTINVDFTLLKTSFYKSVFKSFNASFPTFNIVYICGKS